MSNNQLITAAQEVVDQWRKHGEAKVPAWVMVKLIEALDQSVPGTHVVMLEDDIKQGQELLEGNVYQCDEPWDSRSYAYIKGIPWHPSHFRPATVAEIKAGKGVV